MEKRAFLIPLYCALGFVYLGFRYGMYAHESWTLTFGENLGQMLIWGTTHSIALFLLVATTLFAVTRNTENYEAKLLAFVFLEVLGIGVPSGIFIIKGLIADPWYLASLALFAGVTALMSVIYVNTFMMERKKDKTEKAENTLFLEHLKLKHRRYLQYINSMCWIAVFSLFGYLSAIFFAPQLDDPLISVLSRVRLFVVNVIGIIYFSFGFTFGVVWQMMIKINQIEDMILKLSQ